MAGNDTPQRDPDQIRNEIRQTRARMSKTIEELETRLDPQRLKREATETIREQTVGRVENFADDASRMVKGAGTDVFETIKDNPMPSALVAIGLGWLFMERRSNSSREYSRGRGARQYDYNRSRNFNADYENDYGYRGADQGFGYEQSQADLRRQSRYPQQPMRRTAERFRQGGYETDERFRQAGFQGQYGYQNEAESQGFTGKAQDKAQQVVGKAQDKAQEIADQAQDLASTAQDKAQEFAGQARDQFEEWGYAAQEKAGYVQNRFSDMLNENPLLVGAAALAVGAVIGMSLPGTPQEDQLIGEQRDKLMEKAQTAASDTMEKAQHVAEKAGDAAKEAAKDEAQKQNLTQSG